MNEINVLSFILSLSKDLISTSLGLLTVLLAYENQKIIVTYRSLSRDCNIWILVDAPYQPADSPKNY